MEKKKVKYNINGKEYEAEVNDNELLSGVLRERLGFKSVKVGCETGDCGVCTVILNGNPVKSCMMLACQANGGDILTVEGLSEDGNLHPVQEAFIEEFATQCGFCTPAMILTGYALLKKKPKPTEDEIKKALAGVLCRCTGYVSIIKAIKSASQKMGGK
jgi:carbon-monoxide dehydrogenase small subunit